MLEEISAGWLSRWVKKNRPEHFPLQLEGSQEIVASFSKLISLGSLVKNSSLKKTVHPGFRPKELSLCYRFIVVTLTSESEKQKPVLTL